jgi:hypothetical protein
MRPATCKAKPQRKASNIKINTRKGDTGAPWTSCIKPVSKNSEQIKKVPSNESELGRTTHSKQIIVILFPF